MAEEALIRKTCQTIRDLGIDIDQGPVSPALLSTSPQFEKACRDVFSFAEELQKGIYPDQKPSLWNAARVQSVASYLKKHGVPFQFVFPGEPGVPFYASRGKVFIGLVEPPQTPEAESKILDHEMGHLRDDRRVLSLYPDLKGTFESSKGNYVRLCRAYLEIFENHLPWGEQARFKVLTQETLGDWNLLSNPDLKDLGSTFSEVLRWGEEIRDPRKVAFQLKDFKPVRFSSPAATNPGGHFNFERLFFVALFKEAGAWEEFKKEVIQDPVLIARYESDALRPRIEFFQMVLRGAKQFQESVANPSSVPHPFVGGCGCID